MKRSRADAFVNDCAVARITEDRAQQEFESSFRAERQDLLIEQLIADHIQLWRKNRKPRNTVTRDTLCTLLLDEHGWRLTRDDTGDVLFIYKQNITPHPFSFHGNDQKEYIMRDRSWAFATNIPEAQNINHKLTTDTMLNIFQYLPLWFILSSCRYVSKQWAAWSKHDKLWNLALARLRNSRLYSTAWAKLPPMQQVIGHTFMSWPPAKRQELHATSKTSLVVSRARSVAITSWSQIMRRGAFIHKPIFNLMIESARIKVRRGGISLYYEPDMAKQGKQMSISLEGKEILRFQGRLFQLRFERNGKWVSDGVAAFWRPFWCPLVESFILRDVSRWWGKHVK